MMKSLYMLTKICLVFSSSKAIKKWSIIKNPKTSHLAFFQNAQRDVVEFFISDNFLIAFEKKDKA